jgi:hypothetical protein
MIELSSVEGDGGADPGNYQIEDLFAVNKK